MMLTGLTDIARSAGLQVVELAGWQTRGDGTMKGVETVTCHHTAGPATGNIPSLKTLRDGRSDLPGPLCHYGLGRDGTVYVVAAGRANHAGVSRALAYTNPYAIGIEAEAHGVPGTVTDWPAAQLIAYRRLCKALVDHYGLTVADVRGHKETCSPGGRKTDPDFSMPAHRAAVAAVKLGAPATPPAPPKETDMDWTDKVPLTATDASVWNRTLPPGHAAYRAGDTVTFADMVKYPTLARKQDTKIDALTTVLQQLVAGQAALAAAVGALAGSGSITAVQVQQAAEAGAAAALAELGHDLQQQDGDDPTT